MSRTQQGSLFKMKRKESPDVWVFRWYDNATKNRTYKTRVIGSVTELRTRKDAERAVRPLRININSEVWIPERVSDLIAHFNQRELTLDRRAFATIEGHKALCKRYIEPVWGQYRLDAVRTMHVEEWLHSLPLAPASKTKIKSSFSVLYNHAIRWEWLTFNPISKVRTSAKRLREKDVLSPEEFQALLPELSVRDVAMVLLAGSTGLRRSEMIALTWKDVNTVTLEVNILRSCVRNRFGETKTDCSKRPVPLHPLVLSALLEWKEQSIYRSNTDFLFPSNRSKGTRPISPDMVLRRHIRPALVRAGIVDKQIGWHNFRHSLATNLRSMGVDIKVAQELLRHANSRTTLDIYTRAVSSQKREANSRLVEMLLPNGIERASAPTAFLGAAG